MEARVGVGLEQFTLSFFHHDVTNISQKLRTHSLYKSTGYFIYVNLYKNQTGLQLLVTISDIQLITIWPLLFQQKLGAGRWSDGETNCAFISCTFFSKSDYRDCTEKLCSQYKSLVSLGFKQRVISDLLKRYMFNEICNIYKLALSKTCSVHSK